MNIYLISFNDKGSVYVVAKSFEEAIKLFEKSWESEGGLKINGIHLVGGSRETLFSHEVKRA